MSSGSTTYLGGRLFDGTRLREGQALRVADGKVTDIGPELMVARDGDVVELGGDILSPGYTDLQVNGGGGVMLGDDPSVATLSRIANAHRALGTTAFLPTLITDTPDKTRAAIAAVADAVTQGTPGIAGLHLEGPHLSVARKGAHDAALIRPMTADDLDLLLTAAKTLPVLKITVAPESVSEAQVAALVQAGVLVSLGHTDADFDTCARYLAAGARCVTHLFNAMRQLGSRDPGLVGATLSAGGVHCGLIADGIHVHPASIRAAWTAKAGPGRIFLVSDAMAVAGTDMQGFALGGRDVARRDGALRLSDGTLAGADLDLTRAIRVLVTRVGIPLQTALQSATSIPAALIGRPARALLPGSSVHDLIRIRADLSGVAALG